MGGISDKQISVVTLNYSGILLSPFEFFSQDMYKQQATLSTLFLQLLKQKFPDFSQKSWKWNVGKIDQKMQKGRYSPIYDPTVGIYENKLVNEKQFNQLWNDEFNKQEKILTDLVCSKEEKQRAKIFDFLCYKTLVMSCYKVANLDNVDKLNPKQYMNLMNNFFNKIFLNEQKKINKTLNALEYEKIDVAFLQQANEAIIKALSKIKQYKLVMNKECQSIIIIRKSKFCNFWNTEQIISNIGNSIMEDLNWNKDTAVCFVDRLILISGHLSSKKQKNPDQVCQMFKSLNRLQKIYPFCNFIVGCDANTYLKTNLPFAIYPDKCEIFTTFKSRTWLQVQVNKAQVVAQQCRDHLISDLEFHDSKVVTILGENSKNVNYIPTDRHPYDHFVVKANITVRT